jgi:hypothetical protein
MRPWKIAASFALAAVVIVIVAVWAAQPHPVDLAARQTFDASTEGWFAYGAGTRVTIIRKPEDVKQGSGALELEYTVAPNQVGSAVLLVADRSLAQMRLLRFWFKTDDDTAAAVVLSEKKPDGGDYAAWFWSPKQQWQFIELRPEDFALNEGPADAKDSTGRLELDKVQAIGFIDIGQFFGSISQDPTYPLILKTVSGTHRLQVDEFEMLKDAVERHGARTRIGDPSRGFVSWITLGGATLSRGTPGGPLDEVAFEVRYERSPGKYAAVAHGLSSVQLSTATALSFDVASVLPAKLIVYLEERNPGSDAGPRYSSSFEVPGGSVRAHRRLAFSEFTYDGTSPPDPDGRLTPDKLKTISLIDVEAAAPNAVERNTLWLSPIDGVSR